MNRRRFRWWHGMTLGALVGVALWQTLSLVDGSRVPTIAAGLSLRQFTQIVTRSAVAPAGVRADTRRLADVTVHPPLDGKQLVTARMTEDDVPAQRVEFVASVPFVYQPPTPRPAPQPMSTADAVAQLLGGRRATAAVAAPPPAQTFASVRDFLVQRAPSIGVRYAWWEDRQLQTSAAFGAPLLLLGVLLPFALQCLVWAGLLAPLPPPEPKPLPAAPPEPPAKPKLDVDALVFADAQLDALTSEMAENLAARVNDGPTSTVPGVASFEPAATSSSHAAAPLEPIAPQTPHDPTSFDGGVYYPVHRPKRGET